jgi:ring-1,2-phenylacetyl-CoA epoxidase subunit PaaD
MTATVEEVWAALEDLADPEIPVISLRELGILREVRAGADGLEVVITPTYSGCPAMGQIEDDLRSTLEKRGISARIVTRLAPAWTTDWISDAGKEKLRAYGIAPPHATPAASTVVRFIARPAAKGSRALSALRLGQHGRDRAFRLDGLQGAVSLRRTAASRSIISSRIEPQRSVTKCPPPISTNSPSSASARKRPARWRSPSPSRPRPATPSPSSPASS